MLQLLGKILNFYPLLKLREVTG